MTKAAKIKIGFRDICLIYPIWLFGLPNSLRPEFIPIAPESILMVFLVCLYGLGDLATGCRHSIKTLMRIPKVAYLLFLAVGFAWFTSGSSDKNEYLLRLILWMFTFYFAFFLAQYEDGRRRFFNIWILLAVGGALYLIISPSKWGEAALNIMAWEHRTGFGYFLVVPSLFLVYRTLDSKRWNDLLLNVVLSIPVFIGLFLTFSRGPWAILYAGVLFIFIYSGRKLAAFIYIMSTVLVFLTAIMTSESEIALRLRSIYDFNIASSSFYRFDLLYSSLKGLPEIGILGLGPNGAGTMIPQYTIQKYQHMFTSQRLTTDSDIVWLLIEAGPLSLLCLVLLLTWWGSRIQRNFRRGSEATNGQMQNLSMFVVFLALIVFDNVLSSPLGWFILGFGCGSIASGTIIKENVASRTALYSSSYSSGI